MATTSSEPGPQPSVSRHEPQYDLDTLINASPDELKQIFAQLPAPSAKEMDGEYASEIPAYANVKDRTALAALGFGDWLGKSYTPTVYKHHQGHGLNQWKQPDGSVRRVLRFAWDIEPSARDGRSSLVMKYAAFDNWGRTITLIDEVRAAAKGLYLCTFATAVDVPGFSVNGEGGFFILHGPQKPFVGPDDIVAEVD
ncbi:hypothetical protein ASPBRDRAFT_201261 [Aspergillus brasiliensis CBS 101740]|uniref:Uncharacterized protein n=1 Tax=Aspergillus brasiliensis (strain CBS 101740 / IMI 381727 / IBT 21946) TaxID=767769 RepID=A0A1L9U3N4_ASPBC|nr:hypothetical protein ASPBRDRAFT_201261 [Aspergillus brasiliensis CBS 101740]